MVDSRFFDLVIFVLTIQTLLTVICFYDYTRHNRKDGFDYLIASFFLPGIGIGITIFYLMRRKEFGTRDIWQPELSTVTSGPGFTVETDENRVRWNYQLRGWPNLRQRLVYTVALQSNMVGLIILGLLLVWVAMSGWLIEFIIFFLFVYFLRIFGYVWDSRNFSNVTAGVDSRAGLLAWDGKELELTSIKNVELVRVSDQYLARISHGSRHTNAKLLPIPDTQVGWFRKTLTDHDVELEDRTLEDSNDKTIKQRLYVAPAELLGVPLLAVALWVFI